MVTRDGSRWGQCARKARFKDEHTANRRAAELGFRAYPCKFCRGWHLSSLPFRDHPHGGRRDNEREVKLALAKRALAELERKGVKGPLLDRAKEHVAELELKEKE